MLKRLFDVLVSLVLLVLTVPIQLLLGVWIWLDSPGPVLFRQQRVGLGGRTFQVYKLRTMVADASEKGGYSTATGDVRITRAGRFLRQSSLDELPQLVNVLKGDMSLVGPRPDTPAQERNYSAADWAARHSVRPGITGPAQARLRSAATPEQRLALDLDYVRRSSFLLDLAILAETAFSLFRRKGV